MAEQRRRAIVAAKQMREVHVKWLRWIDEGHATPKEIDIAGNRSHHQEAVNNYDLILAVLADNPTDEEHDG